ncbi:hypothetical protein LG284_08395 [Citricoccus nitrophenolicus]
MHRIHHELGRRLNRIEADPPVWYDELAQHRLDPANRRAAAADVLVWRAVSGQDDAETPLGKAPTEKDATARYHHAAHIALHPAPDGQPEDHGARHNALVSGLSDNWIDLKPPKAAEGPVEERVAQDAPDRDREAADWGR